MDNPKPKLNLDWYKGQDLYSEGDVENLIMKLIMENEPENYSDAIYNNFCWSTYYHLTPLRQNILNWYPFMKDAYVLEIGCGLGAVTGLLCDRCKEVVSVELSKRRATATQWRCREKDNLEIIVGNINDIKFDRKFDYITLIGVLEYQGMYTDSENPYLDFLKKIKSLLKPNGVLLIAIENKYGLKYWCGAKEDHTQIPFDGINQYAISGKKVKTFSRIELDRLVSDCGFANRFFYYPMPDYKLPTVIYSQKKLPDHDYMQNLKPYYIPDNTSLIADETELYQDIIENGVFEFFANSFLIECTNSDDLGKITCAMLNAERQDQYCTAIMFTNTGMVEKMPLRKNGSAHIRQTLKNQEKLARRGKHVWDAQLSDEKLISQFANAQLLSEYILDAYHDKNEAGIYNIFDEVYQEILSSSEHLQSGENIIYALGLDENNSNSYGPILKVGYIDMILRNAFYIEQEIYWFDQEWILEAVPASYILYRGILALYNEFEWVDNVIPMDVVIERYGITGVREKYYELEMLFSASITDDKNAVNQIFRGVNKNICITNIKKLLDYTLN